MNQFILIDGNSLLNRAFYAMPSMKTSSGDDINAVYGFLKMLSTIKQKHKPTHMAIAFDVKRRTFRNDIYPEYKGTRKEMPEELKNQLPILKEILDILKIARVEQDGFEADDLIGTLSSDFVQDSEIHIITGDKDALQLVNKKVKVDITIKGVSEVKTYDIDEVIKEFQITPGQMSDFKGLCGDTSDNIPGVPGVGKKTAAKLLNQFNTLEEILISVNEIEKEKLRMKISTHSDVAMMSKALALIKTDIDLKVSIDDFKVHEANETDIVNVLLKYNLKALIRSYVSSSNQRSIKVTQTVKQSNDLATLRSYEIKSIETLKFYIEKIEGEKVLYYTFLADSYRNNIRVLRPSYGCFSTDGINAVVVDFQKIPKALELLKNVFENGAIKKYGYSTKNDYIMLFNASSYIDNLVFDGEVMAYLLSPESKNFALEMTLKRELNMKMLSEESIIGKGQNEIKYSSVVPEKARDYAIQRLTAICKLEKVLTKQLSDTNLTQLYRDIELPLVEVLASIQYEGFSVATEEIIKQKSDIDIKLKCLENQIFNHVNERFNINSNQRLGEVLFEELNLDPSVEKGKRGYPTNEKVLNKLKKKHPIIKYVQEYRSLTKLKTTYLEGLLKTIDDTTGKVHTSLNQTVAITGRLSSKEPNLQSIPVKKEVGRLIRKVFIGTNENVLIDADYSQIELRILAHLSEDKNLVKAFQNGEDVHKQTASKVFMKAEESITRSERDKAKEVNFGIIYGMSDYGLSENLNISRILANNYLEAYFREYDGVKQYLDSLVMDCKKNGSVSTLFNRKREIPDINHPQYMTRMFSERVAKNTPVQGTAADIIKIAMINVYKRLKKEKLKSKLILQIHDELIVDTRRDEVEIVKSIVTQCMNDAVKLIVPLEIDINVARTWYEAK